MDFFIRNCHILVIYFVIMQSLWSGLPSIYLLCAVGALQMDECRPDGNLNLAAHTVLLL